jgi:hypothetical protein
VSAESRSTYSDPIAANVKARERLPLLYRERALGMRALGRLSGEHRMRSPRPVSRRGAGQAGAPGGINNNANRSYINKTTRHHRIVGKRRYIDFRQARIDVLLVRWGPAVARLRSVEILRGEDRRSDGPARCPLQASSSDLGLWRYPTGPSGCGATRQAHRAVALPDRPIADRLPGAAADYRTATSSSLIPQRQRITAPRTAAWRRL